MTVQPGGMLSWIIREVTGELAVNCGQCGGRVALMNQKGWWWCWRNRKTIVGWIVQEASVRGVRVDSDSVGKLVVTAFQQFHKFRKQKGEVVQTYVIVKTYTIEAESVEAALTNQANAELIAVGVSKRPTAGMMPPTMAAAPVKSV
jgi:hypothetical protein